MERKKIGVILTGGYIEVELVQDYLMTHDVLWVIAVDKGLMAAHSLSLPVDMIVGDFDSVDTEVLTGYKNGAFSKSPTIIKLQPEKDMTDTQVALEQGVEQYGKQEEIVIFGATGTRMDHALANINLLMIPLCYGVKACILDRNNKIYLKRESFGLNRSNCYGDYVSLLPFTEEVIGLTLSGFRYPLDKYTLKQGSSLGVSNVLIEENASITFDTGILIVIESKD